MWISVAIEFAENGTPECGCCKKLPIEVGYQHKVSFKVWSFGWSTGAVYSALLVKQGAKWKLKELERAVKNRLLRSGVMFEADLEDLRTCKISDWRHVFNNFHRIRCFVVKRFSCFFFFTILLHAILVLLRSFSQKNCNVSSFDGANFFRKFEIVLVLKKISVLLLQQPL